MITSETHFFAVKNYSKEFPKDDSKEFPKEESTICYIIFIGVKNIYDKVTNI